MASAEEIRLQRIEKIKQLKERGINPYPPDSRSDIVIVDLLYGFDEKINEGNSFVIGGRIMATRGHGGLIFADIYDGTGKIQALMKADNLSNGELDIFNELIDIGDFIEIEGKAFVTKRGEKSIEVSSWRLLSKSLRPLPDKWHGLQDPDDKFRKRYLDILMDESVRDIVYKRAKFWRVMREFLQEKGFLEVQTPILENTAGGADARPFVTHHNALDLDVFLRISAGELWQKKLMVAGFPKTFEIGRIFRNEGMDAEHLQDYTQMEFYWGYADYKDGMGLVKEMYRKIVRDVFGTSKFEIRGFVVDFEKEWETYDFTETIKQMTGIDISKATLAELETKLSSLGVIYDKRGFNFTRAVDNLWKFCRKQIAGPGFLINVPVYMEPLAKRNRENNELVERFQVIIAGSENGKGYSELNDPLDQADRFAEQSKLREAGDDEAQMFDYDFVEALEYGMPPTCGFGVSERLFSFLMDKPARETQIFPLMRPRDEE